MRRWPDGCSHRRRWYHDIAPTQALGITRLWLDRERTCLRQGFGGQAGEDPASASVHVHTARETVEAIDRLLA